MNKVLSLQSISEMKMGLGKVASSVMDLSSLFVEDFDDVPTVTESIGSLSRDDKIEDEDSLVCSPVPLTKSSLDVPKTVITPRKLQWEFHGLTIWLHMEEFDNDITNAIDYMAESFNIEAIPKSHVTAIYGMMHLSEKEARTRFRKVKDKIGQWPKFSRPTAVVSDIAVEGLPGQVCSIAWCELTMKTNDAHEEALDKLYSIFYDDEEEDQTQTNSNVNPGKRKRDRPWKPHNSFAYDNPENVSFTALDAISYVAVHPSLLSKERRVEAISLWDTNGKMGDWKCLDRIYF